MPILPDSSQNTTPIGIGCAWLTAGSLRRHDQRLIHAALDAGARHFDTAPLYGMGTSEEVLGKALQGRSEAITITTKAGQPGRRAPTMKLIARSVLGPLRRRLRGSSPSSAAPPSRRRDFSPSHIQASLENSLRVLRRSHVDVLALHEVRFEDLTDDLLTVLDVARVAGKFGALGLATTRAETIRILAAYPEVFSVVQYSWSALDAPLSKGNEEPFRITHRALKRGLAPIQNWISVDHAARTHLSAICDADLSDSAILARAVLGGAMVENSGGITLVASHAIKRTSNNVAMGLDPSTLELGKKFLVGLRSWAGVLPAASEP